MAHLIDLSNHRANMAYVGKVPWHGLGQQLTEGAPLEIWAREAGMDFAIDESPVIFQHGDQVGLMNDRRVLFRDDTNTPLAVVSDRFKVVQPLEVLEFFRDLVGKAGDYELETAGVLDGGRKYWALAKYKDQLNFGGDIVKPYLQVATAIDGSMNTIANETTIRTVCNNTLKMSLRDQNNMIKVRHTSVFDAASVKRELGVIETINDFKADVEALINKAISHKQAVEVFVELVAKRDNKGDLSNEKAVKRVVSEIMASLISGPGANLETANGTAWGALNAVTLQRCLGWVVSNEIFKQKIAAGYRKLA